MSEEQKTVKQIYQDLFKVGVACEHIHGKFTNNEIGNPEKEAMIVNYFGSMTCANELKPAYNMGWSSPEATEDYLPFVINPGAKIMLDFAKSHQMPVRGHVMVWHSQCADEAFCKHYDKITIPTDPELLKENPMLKHFEKLDPVCFVDRETMIKRMGSYIRSLLTYMYEEGYADIIYAWDVVNEAIELDDHTETGLRNSYWYRVIGDDFIYWAFYFAKHAVLELSVKYAEKYGVDPADSASIKRIQPSLFYNDYNEFMPDKRDAIIAILSRETKEHGSVFSEGLIDGIGMQGHLSDNTNLDEYMDAVYRYGKLVNEIHITELDVKCTCSNINAEYYQAVFYQELFSRLIAAKKDGINITNVTVWGLTDDNSWIRGNDPLLFRGDLTKKKSYDAIMYAAIGGDLGEPEQIQIDLSDRFIDFEKPDGKPVDFGFKMKGFGFIEMTQKYAHSGTTCLACEKRFGEWCGMSFDVSDFIGQTIEVSAWVKSSAPTVVLLADVTDRNPEVAKLEGGSNEWTLMKGVYQIPSNVHAMALSFGSKEAGQHACSPIYVDDISIKLIGQEESFEGSTHTAKVRGTGHLPLLLVTDQEAHESGKHSLHITRHEKEATVKFDISSYIGCKVNIRAYVKTADTSIEIGLDTASPTVFAQVPSPSNDWTLVETIAEIPADIRSAFFYLATNGIADYYVDDIFVTLA